MLVRKTLNTMNKHIKELEGTKRELIFKLAKTAKEKNLPMQYNLAISGLKMTLATKEKSI